MNIKQLLNWRPAKRRLVVHDSGSSLYLAFFLGNQCESSEKILTRETPEESLEEQISSFLQKKKPRDTIFMLSRAEVFQKELQFTGKSNFEKKLEEALPYSPKELAYGLSFDAGQTKGTVLALPEKNLKEKLRVLNQSGIFPDEIITEDQAALWLLLERNEKRPVLLLNHNEERILAVFSKMGKVIFSRVFNLAALHEILQELSLILLESAWKPEKVLLTGDWAEENQSQIHEHFSATSVENIGESSTCLQGGNLWGKYPLISLLPREEKVKKWMMAKRRLYREAGLSFVLFAGIVCLGFLLHLNGIERQTHQFEKEVQTLRPDVEKGEKIIASLRLLSEFRASKQNVLGLLKELSTKIPPPVQLSEINIDTVSREFVFKGESPSNSYLSETVHSLESTQYIEGAKLGQTRLQKKLDEDYFQFEVDGQWKV